MKSNVFFVNNYRIITDFKGKINKIIIKNNLLEKCICYIIFNFYNSLIFLFLSDIFCPLVI